MTSRNLDLIIDQSTDRADGTLQSQDRLTRRLDAEMTSKINELLASRGVTDLAASGPIKLRIGLAEPSFRFDRETGNPDHVIVGNPKYRKGDIIKKPPGGAAGSSGSGSSAGQGEKDQDEYVFQISSDDLMRRILDGLELPNMKEKKLQRRKIEKLQPSGHRPFGPPATLDVIRSASNALGRRRAFHRPSLRELEDLEAAIEGLKSCEDESSRAALKALEHDLVRMRSKRSGVSYLDPIDLRFRRNDIVEEPVTAAVMFCIMDVSGSMTEHHKDLAKRFFWLLKYFLEQEYNEVTVVYVRHTDTASEVDENTFFFDRETGGTVVVSALEKVVDIIKERFPLEQYNIYCCQATDGDTAMDYYTHEDDALSSALLLQNVLLPMSQYYAYIEVHEAGYRSQGETTLWAAYSGMDKPSHFAMKQVSEKGQIYPVFQNLFSTRDARRKLAR